MFVSIENSAIFAHNIAHPKQKRTYSQEKVPFRDKNQTLQINISVQGGIMLHRIRANNKPFLLSLLLKMFYIEGDKRKPWSL